MADGLTKERVSFKHELQKIDTGAGLLKEAKTAKKEKVPNPSLAEKQEIKGLGHSMQLVTSEKG